MKKKWIILLLLVVTLGVTGCSDKETEKKEKEVTVVCTKTDQDDDGYSTEEKVTVKRQGDVMLSVHQEQTMETSTEMIAFAEALYQGLMEMFKDVNGITSDVRTDGNKITMKMDIDFAKLDLEKLKEVGQEFADPDTGESDDDFNYFQDGKPLFSLYQKENLDGYTCR